MKIQMQLLILLLCLPLLLGCPSSETTRPREELTLQLKWLHQAQFAGFYTARDNGLYAGNRLKVSFLEGGQEVEPTERLLSGKADFAVASPEEVLIQRSRGAPLKAIAAIYRHSAVVFAAREETGILRPADFPGHSLAIASKGKGIRDFELQFQAMMRRLQIDTSLVERTPYDPSYAGFFKGEVDITPTYYSGGLIKIRNQGLDPHLIWPADYGIRFYSDILVTTEGLIAKSPDLVRRFLQSSLQGWQEALGSSEETVKTILHYAGIKDQQLQAAMLESMLPLIHTGRGPIGAMEPGVWRDMYGAVNAAGLLRKPFDVQEAYTLRFLRHVYPDEKP